MLTPKIPEIKGVTVMSPLDMNEVRFDKKHTVLTPEILECINCQDTKASDNGDSLNSSKP